MDDFDAASLGTSAKSVAAREKAVKSALAILGKHFDCVLVLASTSVGPEETGRIFNGIGNIYGQHGMAQWYLHSEYCREAPGV